MTDVRKEIQLENSKLVKYVTDVYFTYNGDELESASLLYSSNR